MAGGVSLLFLIVMGCLAFLYFYPGGFGRNRLVYVLLVFFLLRGTLAILNFKYEFFPLQMDAMLYHEMALDMEDMIHRYGWASLFCLRNYEGVIEPGYIVPLGICYHVFSKDALVGFILNTFLFMLTGYNVYRIGRVLFHEHGAILAALFYSVLPYSVLESTYLHRDPLVNYILSEFFLRLFCILQGRWTVLNLTVLVVTIVYSGILRRENLVLILLVLSVLSLFYVFRKRSLLTAVKLVLAAVAILFAFILIIRSSQVWLFSGFGQVTKFEMLQNRLDMYEPESGYLVDQEYKSYSDLLLFAPGRAFYFLFSPLPWMIFKKSQYLGMAETFFIVVALFCLPKALRQIYRKNSGIALVATLYLALGILGAGLVQTNSAGAQRHRTQFTFLMVAVGIPVIGSAKRQEKSRQPEKGRSYAFDLKALGTGR